MSDASPPPTAGPTDSSTSAASAFPSETTAPDAPAQSSETSTGRSPKEGLGHTRTSGIWASVVALVVLLVLLAIFVLQNVQQVQVSYFGWEGRAPLAAALLIATASGALIAVVAGTLRILQLRRRVRRAQKH